MSRGNSLKVSPIRLPSPMELKESIPLTTNSQQFIENSRQTISNILNGTDPRMLLVIGPCSIHDIEAAKEYATKLQQLQEKVQDNFLILMRVYFAKSRTTTGWKGMLFDPDLDNSYNIKSGLTVTRQLLVDLADMGIATAAEFLDSNSCPYFSDLISWGCIGARTSESQTHREFASGLPMPIAFKNNTDGNVNIAVNGALTASSPHHYLGIDESGALSIIATKGNSDTHIVLRGGESETNYDPQSISNTLNLLKEKNLIPKVIIDCSHDNSRRDEKKQTLVFESVINQVIEGNQNISGFILESNLESGNQYVNPLEPSALNYGISITDKCLDWRTTEKLVLWGNDKLNKNNTTQNHDILEESHATSLITN